MSHTPTAIYSCPDIPSKNFEVDITQERFNTTNGKSTGPSEHVLNAGQVDQDKPSDPKHIDDDSSKGLTALSKLRCQLTGLQDDINDFLTQRMEHAKNKKLKVSDEKRLDQEINELLDGGDGQDE
ncbi:hypothetical protein KAFR_0F01660 [Kazachstania africana CBS 2517]|uniref:EKC/KEOPS complex subunit GON7 n=1 Tax=Kazachstania africana (strain ATCC 22294 / BCRC 22015 / CBS 2517 / CECT 1963 / NBRC 1671 / NRRL Y-8276) TaxID=1071382 RepID=H2AWL3_KAZAF|nr:hypothetical protein KAFR_0F01660 [Kazachstania africana CBS 2517]CCF58763.1 hypothetical protein KAFR_0F01660 [Kazachstania africana CBS 2517]